MYAIPKEYKKEIEKYQNLYFIAKAEYETIKGISEENETKVLKENYFADRNGDKVEAGSYRIADDKEFERFMVLHFIENKKSGLPVTKVNKVVSWPYKKKMMELEKKLLDLQLETAPEFIKEDIKKLQSNYNKRKELLDLILKLDVYKE